MMYGLVLLGAVNSSTVALILVSVHVGRYTVGGKKAAASKKRDKRSTGRIRLIFPEWPSIATCQVARPLKASQSYAVQAKCVKHANDTEGGALSLI